MAKTKTGVRLSGRFSPGTEVELYPRVGVMFDRAHVGSPMATTTVDAIGTIEFEGLDVAPGTRLWVAGPDADGVWRGVQVTAKARVAELPSVSPEQIRDQLRQTQPPSSAVQATTTTGARSTTSTRVVGGNGQPFAHPKVGIPTQAELREESPAPYSRIEDVEPGTVLRSHTVTGESHPVDLDIPDGQMRQDQVPETVFQASCTPLGTATILPVQPSDAAAEAKVALQPTAPVKASPKKA